MKRLWLGVAILLTLLFLGALTTWFMDAFHEALSEDLTMAASAAAREDWETALAYTRKAEEVWQRGKRAVASVADHEPLEQVDNVFAQLRICAQMGQTENFALTCVHLAELARALGESHGLYWWNLL